MSADERFPFFPAMVIGVIVIGFGFVSAYVGNILQAALSLSSAAVGPICAVFLSGVTLPFVNTTVRSAPNAEMYPEAISSSRLEESCSRLREI